MQMKHAMVATDGSHHAERAVELASELARLTGAKLTILHVQRETGSELIPPGLEEYARLEHVRLSERDVLRAAAQKILQRAKAAAQADGVALPETMLLEGDPARGILDAIRELGVDTIVLGSRGLGDLRGLMLGSVSHKVAHAAPCHCIIVR
jgi:nucleotide-binding universal stress UspA family protein